MGDVSQARKHNERLRNLIGEERGAKLREAAKLLSEVRLGIYPSEHPMDDYGGGLLYGQLCWAERMVRDAIPRTDDEMREVEERGRAT